jgi:predicted aldo/keto reductase-like oxidoreductase
MEKRILGKTGIEVTELCFGALPMGPLQKNMPVEQCTEVVIKALEEGIGFIDTAQSYRTYEPIRKAMKATGIRPVITTKSHATDYEGMVKSINLALDQLDIDYVDIFLLHAARADEGVFDQRAGAIQCLKDYKAKGLIKAIGISTHDVRVANLAADRPDMDIVFPIVNKSALGIMNGTLDDMLAAIKKCSSAGKGVYLMKVLGGGNLINDYCDSVDFARSIEGSQSIAIGMVSPEEVKFNVDYFNNSYDPERMPTIKGYSKRYHIVKTLCKGCKTCISVCPNYAIDFDDKTEMAVIDHSKCLTCGYCTPVCPEFAIRTI